MKKLELPKVSIDKAASMATFSSSTDDVKGFRPIQPPVMMLKEKEEQRGHSAVTRKSLPVFSKDPHYKLVNKEESYSKKGYMNAFMSKVDRFTGTVSLRYMHTLGAAIVDS